MILEGKVVVAQGGGPTAVINQSLVGVVMEARKYPQVTRIYGAVNGVSGIINENFLDLTQETSYNLEQIAMTPSSALFTTRDKPDKNYCKEMFEVFKAHDVRYFFYIGGNDSADTVRIVNEMAAESDYDFRAIHVPKTVDNDLMLNDHTPGYGSAAKFIGNTFTGLNLDNRALNGIHIGIIMGRNAGFLTAASSLAQVYPDDGPHLIYFPENPFITDKYIEDVKKVYDKYGRCVIAVSEGIKDDKGDSIAMSMLKNLDTDAHGNVTLSGTGVLGDLLADLIKDKLKIKRVRADTFGYVQRCYNGCVSEVDAREAREAAQRAVQFALLHNSNGSVTIHRIGDYAVDYRLSSLAEVGGKTKYMPKEFMNSEGNNVTDAFKNYLKPLIGKDFNPGLRLRAPQVEKILKR